MNKGGVEQRNVVSSFNTTAAEDASEDDKFYGQTWVVVFSWQRTDEEAICAVQRPVNCMDNCTIF